VNRGPSASSSRRDGVPLIVSAVSDEVAAPVRSSKPSRAAAVLGLRPLQALPHEPRALEHGMPVVATATTSTTKRRPVRLRHALADRRAARQSPASRRPDPSWSVALSRSIDCPSARRRPSHFFERSTHRGGMSVRRGATSIAHKENPEPMEDASRAPSTTSFRLPRPGASPRSSGGTRRPQRVPPLRPVDHGTICASQLADQVKRRVS